MEFKEALKHLNSSDVFRLWKKDNADSYLVHAFILVEPGYNEWQIGYYDKDKNCITTFRVEKGKQITKNPDADILKDEKDIINPLDESKVNIDINEAVMVADGFQQEKYNAELPLKKIAVLQHLKEGQVWNMTFLTKTYKTLNIKIDADTGKIVKDTLQALFGFDSGKKD